MQRRRGTIAAIATAAALSGAVAVTPLSQGAPAGDASALAAGKPRPKIVKVADDFFSPTELKVKKGGKVKWKWRRTNLNPHNVTLEKGPRGVNKGDYRSATGSIGVKFNRTFKKKGKYQFVCTLHPGTMTQTLTVKR